ncbi:MAG TPA: cell wall hydrolase, partial [Xanthobacteraceae bacterium]|nr:cell wall hydrolase [Xanthobacteraceae bacterium]
PLLFFILNPAQIAHQDLASLLAQQPGISERARTFFLSNPFSTLKSATFSLSIPIGAGIPQLPQLASLDVTGSIPQNVTGAEEADEPAPTINRSVKADRAPVNVAVRTPTVQVVTVNPKPRPDEIVPDRYDVALAFEIDPRLPALGENHLVAITPEEGPRADDAGTLGRAIDAPRSAGAMFRLSRLFFGEDRAGLPPLIFEHRLLPGESVAAKGEVTGEEGRPQSPAERMKLAGAGRAKQEKCLADAVYFEARSEPERGQIAVAQVVINRAFSGFYPDNICGVVYQNAHRYLACQFTFACEGKRLVVSDEESWSKAKQIAHDVLDGKTWLGEIGKATHYHAYWVRPDWIRDMRRIHKIGVHTFYRPRAWEG